MVPQVTGTSIALETIETTFQQDLNSDGVIGPKKTLIQTDGSTSLVEVGNNYFLYAAGTSSGPALEYNGAPITSGEFGAWTPIGAVQISGGGYDVAWDIPGANTYSVWTTNSSGSYLSNVVPQVTGTSIALETIETTFQQDLNSDGVIGPKRDSDPDGWLDQPGRGWE